MFFHDEILHTGESSFLGDCMPVVMKGSAIERLGEAGRGGLKRNVMLDLHRVADGRT
jgi:hypothetical protein